MASSTARTARSRVPLEVWKFGGASLASADQIQKAAALIATKQASAAADASAPEKSLKNVAALTARLQTALDTLDEVRGRADHGGGDILKHAIVYRDQVKPAMNDVRTVADQLELVVDDKYWPIPKYREMLFMM